MLDELAEDHELELDDQAGERLLDAMLGALVAGKRGEREILGRDGVLGEITRRLVQRALQEELSEHLGYPAGQAPPGGAGNSRGRRHAEDACDRSRAGVDQHSAGSQRRF